MKATFLTAGTGSYHCGACMRDNALAVALHRSGHEVALLPMYLPMTLDEEGLPQGREVPVFFGGINVFLQQKTALFRHTPGWLDRLFNNAGLLRFAARRSHLTSAREQGVMTLEMLRVESGRLTKELGKLLAWLEHHEKPDLICLSNALLAGLTRELKARLGVPVLVFFQGEDTFLDHLPAPYRERCWDELRARIPEADALVSPSRFYALLMAERLGLSDEAIEVLPNGIDFEGYLPKASETHGPPVIGFFARMIREKGLHLLVDAFLELHRDKRHEGCRLHIGGACTKGDQPGVEALQRKLAEAGLDGNVRWAMNVTREEKARFLRDLTIFSVPAVYPEAFGLYVIEAMAAGAPVVQPRASSFPELIEDTGGGVLVAPGDASALADAWSGLLADRDRLRVLGERGRRGARERYSVEAMKEGFVALAEAVIAGRRRPAMHARREAAS